MLDSHGSGDKKSLTTADNLETAVRTIYLIDNAHVWFDSPWLPSRLKLSVKKKVKNNSSEKGNPLSDE